MCNSNNQIKWYMLAFMCFSTLWSFGNVLNGFMYFNGTQVIFSWILMFALYFVPYALKMCIRDRQDVVLLPHGAEQSLGGGLLRDDNSCYGRRVGAHRVERKACGLNGCAGGFGQGRVALLDAGLCLDVFGSLAAVSYTHLSPLYAADLLWNTSSVFWYNAWCGVCVLYEKGAG